MFCARLFICASWSPAGKGLTSWLSFVVSSVSSSLSHWYPGSGVVLDCIDSWSLQPYLLWPVTITIRTSRHHRKNKSQSKTGQVAKSQTGQVTITDRTSQNHRRDKSQSQTGQVTITDRTSHNHRYDNSQSQIGQVTIKDRTSHNHIQDKSQSLTGQVTITDRTSHNHRQDKS